MHGDDKAERIVSLLQSSAQGSTRLRLVGDDLAENRRWVNFDAASMIEGCFGVTVPPEALNDAERATWAARLDREWGFASVDPAGGYTRRFWIHDGDQEVGTLSVARSTVGVWLLPLYSLYVRPEARGRAVAARALDLAQAAAVAVGVAGIRLDTAWTWIRSVRFYLRQKFWVRMWKHALTLQRGPRLPLWAAEFRGDVARFSIARDDRRVELIRARRDGERLRWSTTRAHQTLRKHPDDFDLAVHAEATFALALAAEGFPLVRSPTAWAESRREWDLGGPESLARKIVIYEAVARRAGYVIPSPRIPGLAYPDLDDDDD